VAEDAGAAQGEDPVQLGEAQVVADAEAEGEVAERRRDDLLARLLVLGLAVGDAADVDVEHVDLAVGGEVVAVGADQDRGVEGAAGGPGLADAAGEQVNAQLARPAASGGEARAVERLGAGQQLLALGQQVPLLRQGDQLGAVGRRRAHQPLGRGQVAGLLTVRVELYDRCAHCAFVPYSLFVSRDRDR
jgi:hypothetical protein